MRRGPAPGRARLVPAVRRQRSNSAWAIWERPAFWMQTNRTWLMPLPHVFGHPCVRLVSARKNW